MKTKLPIKIDCLLRQRRIDGERIEYRSDWNPVEVLHTICAFANDFHNLGGGYVVLGVEDQNGHPVLPPKGIDPGQADKVQREILSLGNSAMLPCYHPIVADYTIEGRTVLVLWAHAGETRPYRARVNLVKDGTQWAWYIRKHGSTVLAKGADERELLNLAATVPFDDRYNTGGAVEDLSFRLIEQFLRDVGSDLAPGLDFSMEALGRRMNIVGGPSEALFPKNVGLLFFNEAPHKFLSRNPDRCSLVSGGCWRRPLRGKRVSRSLVNHPSRWPSASLIGTTSRKRLSSIRVDRRQNDSGIFPRAAIKEALTNAIYHRSYEEREPVEVRITTDELTILNFPGADRSIRMEELRTGQAISRRYRNHRIGEFLKELGSGRSPVHRNPKNSERHAESMAHRPPRFLTATIDRTWFLVRLPVHTRSSLGIPVQ